MKTVDIVSHCYAVNLPHYAYALQHQATSLMDTLGVRLVICYDKEDKYTSAIIEWYCRHTVLHIVPLELTKGTMSRRCIGRNIAALRSNADIVWFADVDMLFCDGIIGNLQNMEWPENAIMIHPKQIMISKDHATGDKQLGAKYLMDGGGFFSRDFIPKQYNRAIGGVQIVRGDFAREYGYLRGDEKWQQPQKTVLGSFKDDLAYRRFCLEHGSIEPVDLPGIYRLRHSTTSYQ